MSVFSSPEATAVTKTIVSPQRTITAPLANLANRPVSNEYVLPLKSIDTDVTGMFNLI